LQLRLLSPTAVDTFLSERADHLGRYRTPQALARVLVEGGLLRAYQVQCVLNGKVHGLVMGQYRVLDRLGEGGMSSVFLAEHVVMKRRAAIKVLPVDEDCPPAVLERFYAEVRVLADLHHPHIVLAYDAGELPGPGPDLPPLIYLVMELVPGGNLESHIIK